MLLACTGEAGGPTVSTPNPVTLRIGHIQFDTQDAQIGLQQAASSLGFEGLTANNRTGQVARRLAEDWRLSPDGLLVSFDLRTDATFHDGSSVTADAVVESLNRTLASEAQRRQAPALDEIVSIEASGPKEVTIRLKHRSTFFLEDLGSVTITKIAEPNGGHRDPLDGVIGLSGTGPFVLDDGSGEEPMLRRFEGYDEGVPEVQEILWSGYRETRSAWAGLMRGEIDFLYEVPPDAVDFVQRESSIATYSFLRPYTIGLIFNTRRGPLSDSRVRQALNFAVDRSVILDNALNGRGLVASTPIWPLHWAYDQTVPGYSYDPARAIALLDTAVERANSATTPDGRPTRVSFTCLVAEGYPVWERMAQLVRKQLLDVGVHMDIHAVSRQEWMRRALEGDFEVLFTDVNSGPPLARPWIFWQSDAEYNISGYASPAVDAAFLAIDRAPADIPYRNAVKSLQEALTADPPGLFLAWPQVTRAVSRRFHVPSEPDRDILSSISRWTVAEEVARGRD